jgi:hypothetical protein
MDFLLWGSLKYLVYAISAHDVAELQQYMGNARKTVRGKVGLFKHV